MSDMAAPAAPGVRTRPIAVDEYYRMGEVGILRRDERVELLNGRIVEMPPVGPRHSYAVAALHAMLVILLGDRAVPLCQGPVRLDHFSEPQPDIAVVRAPRERYLDAHPTPADALFVIEVSDSTLAYDRGEKLKAYAGAAIPEYWIVDIRHQRIDVYTEPEGDQYQSHRVVLRHQHLASRAFPSDSVDVNALFPRD
jgi:Uma2 family endonuclease